MLQYSRVLQQQRIAYVIQDTIRLHQEFALNVQAHASLVPALQYVRLVALGMD